VLFYQSPEQSKDALYADIPLHINSSTVCSNWCERFFSTEFLGFKVITCLHIEFLNAITTSLSITFPFFLIFLIDSVPCQNYCSLSTSEIIFHMLSCDASICFVM
jgi:hypothetical protein